MKYRLLAVDLDGTLLDGTGRAHPRDREAIRELSARGIPTTIITGRLYSGTRETAHHVGVRGPIGCADGSHVVDAASGRDVAHAGLAGAHAELLRRVLAKVEPITFVMAHDQIVHDRRGLKFLHYVRTWSTDVVPVERATEHPHWAHERGITATVSLGDEAQITAAQAELGRELAGIAQVITFPVRRGEHEGSWAMLVRAAGQTKGTALAAVARHHGVAVEEVVAVGDWWNDVPMFEVAGRSFVMGQAPDAVKQKATDALEADVTTGGGIVEAARRAGWL